jgi:hypothetical protein
MRCDWVKAVSKRGRQIRYLQVLLVVAEKGKMSTRIDRRRLFHPT